MDKDAVTAGVQPIGGLFSTAEIKILICYILHTVREPIPANLLTNTLHYEGIANAFEVSDAISLLEKSGHIVLADKNDDSYIITETGSDVAKTLRDSLSYNVKQRACNAALKMLARFKNTRDTDIKITTENERTYISCSALDRGTPILSIKLLVGDDNQALAIKEKFLDEAPQIYSSIIKLLTKND